MTELEDLKAQIKVLQSKLSFLEKMENHKTPCEIAYKDWRGMYPGTGTWDSFDATRWIGFEAGYNAAYEEQVAENPNYKKQTLELTSTQHEALKKLIESGQDESLKGLMDT